MKSLSQFRGILKAGGRAVDDVVRINQENVAATVDAFFVEYLNQLGLAEKDAAILGSTGKKAPGQSSGDIDIALNVRLISVCDPVEFVAECLEENGVKFKAMKELGIVSLAYPIANVDGKQQDESVQIDLMLTDNLEYARWAWHGPAFNESSYKGIYRNLLNFSIAKNACLTVEHTDVLTETPTQWSRYWLTMRGGLQFGRQTNISEKTGKIIKTVRPIDKKTITMKPDEIVAFLYGESYKAKDILTFEQAMDALLSESFPYKDKVYVILKATADTLTHEGYPIPIFMAKALMDSAAV